MHPEYQPMAMIRARATDRQAQAIDLSIGWQA